MYLTTNLNELEECFLVGEEAGEIDFNGESMPIPTEDEIDELMREMQ